MPGHADTCPPPRRLYGRYLVFFGIGGALWLSSLTVAAPVQYAFWARPACSRTRPARWPWWRLARASRSTRFAPRGQVPDLRAHCARGVRGPHDQRGHRAALERTAGHRARSGADHPGRAVAGVAHGRRPGRAGRPGGDRPLHRREPSSRGRDRGRQRWPSYRRPGRRRGGHDRDRASRCAVRRGQRRPARHHNPAVAAS